MVRVGVKLRSLHFYGPGIDSTLHLFAKRLKLFNDQFKQEMKCKTNLQ